jgi:selenocysteine lyase/cysteine desulfurase
MSTPDWAKVRAEFPALANWTFLNTATFGQLPRCAADAMAQHLARRDELACADFLAWYDDADQIRTACARLINCSASDVAFVPSASAGLAYLTQGLDWKPGDEVLTLENEFPNQLYVSALLQRFGARLRAVPWSQFDESVNGHTRAVLLSTVNYATGFRPPLEDISSFLARREVLLYVDGTQSVGALEFDVQQVRPAMLCLDAYKWLLSPNGAGFVYVAPELREQLPATVIGWRTDRDWREVNALHHGEPRLIDSAEKYEGGGLPFPSVYAMGAAIEMLLAIGPKTVEERVLDLAAQARTMLQSFGAEVNADESQIVTACLPGRDAAALARALKERRILVSARHGRLRISPHLYNDESDIEALRCGLSDQLSAVSDQRKPDTGLS